MPQKKLTSDGKRGANRIYNAARPLGISSGRRKWNAVTKGRIDPSNQDALKRLAHRLDAHDATDDERDVLAIARLLIERNEAESEKWRKDNQKRNARSPSLTRHRQALERREAAAQQHKHDERRREENKQLGVWTGMGARPQAQDAERPLPRQQTATWHSLFHEFALCFLTVPDPAYWLKQCAVFLLSGGS